MVVIVVVAAATAAAAATATTHPLLTVSHDFPVRQLLLLDVIQRKSNQTNVMTWRTDPGFPRSCRNLCACYSRWLQQPQSRGFSPQRCQPLVTRTAQALLKSDAPNQLKLPTLSLAMSRAAFVRPVLMRSTGSRSSANCYRPTAIDFAAPPRRASCSGVCGHASVTGRFRYQEASRFRPVFQGLFSTKPQPCAVRQGAMRRPHGLFRPQMRHPAPAEYRPGRRERG